MKTRPSSLRFPRPRWVRWSSRSNIQVPDVAAGTPVLLETWRNSHGKLTEGGPPNDAGQYRVIVSSSSGREEAKLVSIAELALPLASWVVTLSQASTTGGGGSLNLPVGMVVVIGKSTNPRGKIVTGQSPPSHGRCMVAHENQAGLVEEVDFGQLAVPLETWWTPPSRPDLPAGTSMVWLQDATSRQQIAIGDLWARADKKLQKARLFDLLVPLGSWPAETSASSVPIETKQQRYYQLPADSSLRYPADMKIVVRSSKDLWGTLTNGPAPHGTFEVYFPSEGRAYLLKGTQLAVPIETRLFLDQIGALQQNLDSLKANALTQNDAFDELNKRVKSSAALREQRESEGGKAKEPLRKIAQGERLMLNATVDHNYPSNLRSPSDLVNEIGRIEGDMFAEWIQVALKSPNTWLVGEDAAEVVGNPRNFVLQVLVETAHGCHRRVQEYVSRRTKQMTSFMKEFMGEAHGDVADDVARFERSTFQKGYKEIFAEICPVSPASQTKLARAVFDELPGCVAVSSTLPKVPNALFQETQAIYERIVNSLLMIFLECDIRRPDPIKFSENFASTETWSPDSHQKETFDFSYEGGKLVQGSTQVQVVIPRLSWGKRSGDKTRKFSESKASFVIRDA